MLPELPLRLAQAHGCEAKEPVVELQRSYAGAQAVWPWLDIELRPQGYLDPDCGDRPGARGLAVVVP